MKDSQLDSVIRYQKNRLVAAKMLGGISQEVLQELTIKYLEELQAIKEKEEG